MGWPRIMYLFHMVVKTTDLAGAVFTYPFQLLRPSEPTTSPLTLRTSILTESN